LWRDEIFVKSPSSVFFQLTSRNLLRDLILNRVIHLRRNRESVTSTPQALKSILEIVELSSVAPVHGSNMAFSNHGSMYFVYLIEHSDGLGRFLPPGL
jgi:hypothetical protein